MLSFKKLNNLIGWLVGLFATSVYTLTVEQTASFWDCGEFIAVSYKLMVPHPPGAPLFLLLGRLFSMLAFGNVEQVAFWVNMLTVLSSGMTVLFLFWTVTLLALKIVGAPDGENGDYTPYKKYSVLAASLIGSLAYTFSDSFWFSAAEAEVYGISSFFTAIVVWVMLKWERIENESLANRWLVLLAYLVGLSIGIHLLNLVTIPALAMLYYYRKYKKTTLLGNIIALFAGLVIILIIMEGIIPGLPTIAGKFEILFVNGLGLPFGSGALFFLVAIVAAVVLGIRWSIQKQKVLLNTVLLSLTMILIGYMSYALIPIRSNQQPPIDENDPEDVMSFVSYLRREQYGYRPLLFGQTYKSERVGTETGAARYRRGKDKYEIYDYDLRPTYDKNMLLPRIYSGGEDHPQLYQSWIGIDDKTEPNFFHNIKYMLNYQIGHMYFRYFLWNFAGRDSDDKEAGWLHPFVPTDLSESVAKNKAHDNFYMLPLILGLIGVFFHIKKDDKGFAMTGMLFFLTGVALVIYMNSPPVEPRERDYIYVGSFYAFCIWIGLGTMAVANFLTATIFKGKENTLSPLLAFVVCLIVPAIMGFKGWDNHNRHGRFHSVDQAKNSLNSCAPNAILFTGGDNDTFPLWYAQNVEGVRTDVRVIVLSYFSTDWYAKQLSQKMYESEALPFSLTYENYKGGKNEFVMFMENPRIPQDQAINLKQYMQLVKQDNQNIMVDLEGGGVTATLPSKTFFLDVDSAAVINKGFIPKGKEKNVVSRMVFGLRQGQRALYKSDLLLLDVLANFNWDRPIYFNNTSANTTAIDLRKYMQMEGMAYRLMPIAAEDPSDGDGEVNTEVMYQNMKKFAFRGFDNPNAYHDEEYRKFGANMRSNYFRLAYQYYLDDNYTKAKETLDDCIKNIPDESIPFDYYVPRLVELYYVVDEDKKARELSDKIGKRAIDDLEYIDRNKLDNLSNSALKEQAAITLGQLQTVYKRAIDRMDRKLMLDSAGLSMNKEIAEDEVSKMKLKREFFLKEFQKYDKAYTRLLGRGE